MTQQRFEQFVERQAYDLSQTEHYPWLRNPAALSTLATVLDSTPFLWEHFLRWNPKLHLPVLTHQGMLTRRLHTHHLLARLHHALPAHLTVEAVGILSRRSKPRNCFVFACDTSHIQNIP